ncbi:unnamed protein product [Arabidopsis halleri]
MWLLCGLPSCGPGQELGLETSHLNTSLIPIEKKRPQKQ